MDIITGIGVVALASMAAILVNDYTRLGGCLEDGDDNFSIFSRPAAPVAVSVRTDDPGAQSSAAQLSSSQSREVARV